MSFIVTTELFDSGASLTLKSKLFFVVHPPNENAAIMMATIIKFVFIKVSFKLKNYHLPVRGREITNMVRDLT
jgi:hypothetical protein